MLISISKTCTQTENVKLTQIIINKLYNLNMD